MGHKGHHLLRALSVPRGPNAWLARLLLWCGLAFLSHVALKAVFGFSVHFGWDFLLLASAFLPVLALILFAARVGDDHAAEMNRVAMTDPLTGLLNRRGFTEAVQQVEAGALLIIDIDHFKHVNDRYGHAVGDEVLRAMGNHLKSDIRNGDILGRIGGEEFAIFLVGRDSLEIDRIGERLCRGFVLYNDKVPIPVKVTMSVGAAFSEMAATLSQMYQNADQALYQAKRSGRARLAFWTPPAASRF